MPALGLAWRDISGRRRMGRPNRTRRGGAGPCLSEMDMEGLCVTRAGIAGSGMDGLGMVGLDMAVEL